MVAAPDNNSSWRPRLRASRRDFIIFTSGTYRVADLPFYRRRCRSRVTIAVDGGLSFFLKSRIKPDLLMGDLDSLHKIPRRHLRRVETLVFPVDKDKTDLQLAFEHCLKARPKSIHVVMPDVGQPDHFLGAVMMVRLLDRLGGGGALRDVRFIGPDYEIRLVRNGTVSLVGCQGDVISVIPIADRIVLSCQGTAYDVDRVAVPAGDTRALRNRVVNRRARFHIEGKALLVHLKRT